MTEPTASSRPASGQSGAKTWTLVIHAGDDNTFIADKRLVDQWRNHPNFTIVPVVEQAAYDALRAWQEQIIGVLIAPPGKKNEDAPFAKERLDELVAPMLSALRDKLAAETQRAELAEQRVEELEAQYAGFEGMIAFIRERLERYYPASIFDGSSGDAGPVFVVALREAVAALDRSKS